MTPPILHARLLTALLAALAWPACAHDLWLEGDGSGQTLFQGHRHSSHAGSEIVAYDPAAVRGAVCIDLDGASRQLGPGKGYPAKFPADCASLLVRFSTGYWTKTAWETKNVPKTGLTGVLKSWLAEETLKRIARWHPATARPIGSGLEITPTTDPLKLAIGDKLVVLVTEQGQPRAGVPVAYQGDTRGVTGEDGRVAIRIRRGGVQLLSASLESPLADGQADSAIRAAGLQFELPK